MACKKVNWKKSCRVSKKKMQILESIIWRSKDADEFSKKCLIWPMRHSRGFTREVHLELTDPDTRRRVAKHFHDMCSDNNATHLDRLFLLVDAVMTVDVCMNIKMNAYHVRTGSKCIPEYTPALEEINAIVPADPFS